MHRPVLLKESIELLRPERGKVFVDATINGGGHSKEILKRMAKGAVLIGIDEDNNLIKSLKNKLKEEIKEKKLFLINGNFRNLKKLIRKKADGVIFDLGMSSFQLEMSGRGFSFQRDEPLVMTFSDNWRNKITAMEILNTWSREELEKILKEYGEERFAARIAEGIVKTRAQIKFKKTKDLVNAILNSVPPSSRRGRIHPATRTFQALRIAVNDELNALKDGLIQAFEILNKNGRIVVISFHSLEDRIVKNFFKEKMKQNQGKILTKKPIRPAPEEIRQNPRSRSAKLRGFVKF